MRGEGDKRKEKELRERGVSEREEQVCKRGSRREGVREEEGGRGIRGQRGQGPGRGEERYKCAKWSTWVWPWSV